MATHETIEPAKTGKKGSDRLQCVVVTPERTLFDELVDFVALPLYDGELGILPGHTPLLGVLVSGDVVIHGEGGDQTVTIDEGFISVEHDRVTIVAESVQTAGQG